MLATAGTWPWSWLPNVTSMSIKKEVSLLCCSLGSLSKIHEKFKGEGTKTQKGHLTTFLRLPQNFTFSHSLLWFTFATVYTCSSDFDSFIVVRIIDIDKKVLHRLLFAVWHVGWVGGDRPKEVRRKDKEKSGGKKGREEEKGKKTWLVSILNQRAKKCIER